MHIIRPIFCSPWKMQCSRGYIYEKKSNCGKQKTTIDFLLCYIWDGRVSNILKVMDIASKIQDRWSVSKAWLFQICPSKTLTQISKMGKCDNCWISISILYFHLKYRGAQPLAPLIKILTPAVTWASIQYWYSSSSMPLNSANWAMKAVKYKKLAIAVNQNSWKVEMISYN